MGAVNKDPNWSVLSNASPAAVELCRQMLAKNEAERPTARIASQNPWLLSTSRASTDTSAAPLMPDMLKGLLRVAQQTHFEKFVTRLVATQLDAGKQRDVNDAFTLFDVNGDGVLSRDEVERGLRHLGASPQDASSAMAALDICGSGQISYTQFVAGVMNLRDKPAQQRDELLWVAWQQFCPDSEGHVLTIAVMEALAARGMTVADLPPAFLSELSKDGRGFITFQAFKGLLYGDDTGEIMRSLRLIA